MINIARIKFIELMKYSRDIVIIYFHTGRPATPTFGGLLFGPNAGEITIMIKTRASGIDGTSQLFGFLRIWVQTLQSLT